MCKIEELFSFNFTVINHKLFVMEVNEGRFLPSHQGMRRLREITPSLRPRFVYYFSALFKFVNYFDGWLCWMGELHISCYRSRGERDSLNTGRPFLL